MNLILGTRNDGLGRLRVATIGLFAAFAIGATLIAIRIEMNNPARDEVVHMVKCLERPASYGVVITPEKCRESREYQLAISEGRVREYLGVGSFYIGIAAFLWLITGLMGWVYRGFAENGKTDA